LFCHEKRSADVKIIGNDPAFSNDFHICRALLMAKKAGYTDVYGIPAPGDPIMEAHYIVREGAAILIAKIRGVI
ncbi:MAG: hypothetical protein K6C06_02325, partial [Lachnospiraceae bacterium]|nr:hypothetical protein [Lachnospiraceae bacterium]